MFFFILQSWMTMFCYTICVHRLPHSFKIKLDHTNIQKWTTMYYWIVVILYPYSPCSPTLFSICSDLYHNISYQLRLSHSASVKEKTWWKNSTNVAGCLYIQLYNCIYMHCFWKKNYNTPNNLNTVKTRLQQTSVKIC